MSGRTFPSGLYNGTTYQYWTGDNWVSDGAYDNIDNTYGLWYKYVYYNATQWNPTGNTPIWADGYTIKELYAGIEGYAVDTNSSSKIAYLTPYWSGTISGTLHTIRFTGTAPENEQIFWINLWNDSRRPTTITFENLTGLAINYGGPASNRSDDTKPADFIDAIYLYIGYEANVVDIITNTGNLTLGRFRQTESKSWSTGYYYMRGNQGIRNIGIWHRDLDSNEIRVLSKNPNIFRDYTKTYCGASRMLSSFYVVTGNFSGDFLGGYHYSGDSNYSVSQFPRYIYSNQKCFIYPDSTGSWYISSNDTTVKFYREENEVSANNEYPTGVYGNGGEYPGVYLYVI
jgi:hypothetical protein